MVLLYKSYCSVIIMSSFYSTYAAGMCLLLDTSLSYFLPAQNIFTLLDNGHSLFLIAAQVAFCALVIKVLLFGISKEKLMISRVANFKKQVEMKL